MPQTKGMDLSAQERYSRQILFAPIGEAGQQTLLQSHVAIVGCGALGSFLAGALGRAGVGHLTLVDRDYVEASNLQRQWLYEEADAQDATPKPIAAARALARINSSIRTTPKVVDLTPANIDEVLESPDLILDGTDNFEARYLINDYCLQQEIPWVYGAAVGSYGLVMPVVPGASACLQCVYPKPPQGAQPTCETFGVLGAITAMVAAWQSALALQILIGAPVPRKITTFDVWKGTTRQVDMPAKDAECPACGKGEYSYLDGDHRAPISLCGRDAVQIHERNRPLNLEELKGRLERLAPVRANDFALRFFPAPYELTIFPDGRAIIKGTQDVAIARTLYAKYVGA